MVTITGEYYYGVGRRKEATAQVRLYTGGTGMVMKPEPIFAAAEAASVMTLTVFGAEVPSSAAGDGAGARDVQPGHLVRHPQHVAAALRRSELDRFGAIDVDLEREPHSTRLLASATCSR